MDPIEKLSQDVQALSAKIDALTKSVKTIKTIFYWILVASVVGFVLPLIGLAFVIPQFLQNYTSALNF